jgi:hypothetical protein
MHEVFTYIISAILSALGGTAVYFAQKHFKRMEKCAEGAEERRTQKDILVLKSLKCIGELTVANAVAVKNGHQNGEMEKAQAEFESVDKELNAFLMECAVKKVNKKRGA